MAGPSWVTSNNVEDYGARTHGNLSDEERLFVENSAAAETLAESQDPFADYSYDDWALAKLEERYYVFNTSGCSCPSPSETWGLDFSGTEAELIEWLDMGGRDLQDMSEAFCEFLREIEKSGCVKTKRPAPEPKKSRYDW